MEEASVGRHHGGDIMEEASGRRHQGRHQVREKASGRRHHGGGIMGEASWRSHHGGDIMEEASWRRHHGGGRHHGGTSWRHLADIFESSRMQLGRIRAAPGGFWDSSGGLGCFGRSGVSWGSRLIKCSPFSIRLNFSRKVLTLLCVFEGTTHQVPRMAANR